MNVIYLLLLPSVKWYQGSMVSLSRLYSMHKHEIYVFHSDITLGFYGDLEVIDMKWQNLSSYVIGRGYFDSFYICLVYYTSSYIQRHVVKI